MPWIHDALGADFVAENFHQLVPASPKGKVPVLGSLGQRCPVIKEGVPAVNMKMRSLFEWSDGGICDQQNL